MAVTGEQFEITSGQARAVVTEVGAALRAFEVRGVPHVETFPADSPPPMGSGAVLVPWPNRVLDGRWEWRGTPQQLALSEPARGNASHGLVRHTSWHVLERSEEAIMLEAPINVQPGWPVRLLTTVRYVINGDELGVMHTVTNIGSAEVPFGLGTHPYLRAGHAATDDCTLHLAATTMLPVDGERKVPSGQARPVAGTEHDFRVGRPLDGAQLDTSFGGCRPELDGLVRHTLTGPDGGVELWADPVFRWVQVYTPDGFPGRGRAVAIEPMTCPPNALSTGIDLITLQPGQTWSATWGLRPIPRR